MVIKARDDNPFEDYCPNCGHFLGGESVCPNCSTEIFNEEGLENFEEGEDSADEDEI